MRFFTLFVLLFLLFLSDSFSQTSGSFGFSDPKSLSMAFTYTANSRGLDAIGVNPANLAYDDKTKFSLKTYLPLPALNFYFNTPMSIEKYNYFFGGVDDGTGKTIGRYLSDSEKDELKSMLAEKNFIFNFYLNHLSFSFKPNDKIGAFGFAFVDRFGMRFKPSEGFTDLIFSGLYPNQIYAFSDLIVKSSFWREYSLSYGRKVTDINKKFLKNLYAGISLKIIKGFYYVSTEKNDSHFRLEDDNVIRGKVNYSIFHALSPDYAKNYGKDSIVSVEDFSFSFFPTPSGSGFGFDIGFAGEINEYLKAGISLTDIGSINWDNNQATIKGNSEFSFQGYSTKEQLDSLKEKFNKVESDISTAFSSSLPTTLRIGISFQLDKAPFINSFPGAMLLVFDYNQGFNNEIGNSTIPRFSLGVEWDYINYLPYLRTGISVGGNVGFTWSFGLGFSSGPLEFNFATSNIGSLFTPNSTTKFNFGMDSKWRF